MEVKLGNKLMLNNNGVYQIKMDTFHGSAVDSGEYIIYINKKYYKTIRFVRIGDNYRMDTKDYKNNEFMESEGTDRLWFDNDDLMVNFRLNNYELMLNNDTMKTICYVMSFILLLYITIIGLKIN
jgi:hypothetical protein